MIAHPFNFSSGSYTHILPTRFAWWISVYILLISWNFPKSVTNLDSCSFCYQFVFFYCFDFSWTGNKSWLFAVFVTSLSFFIALTFSKHVRNLDFLQPLLPVFFFHSTEQQCCCSLKLRICAVSSCGYPNCCLYMTSRSLKFKEAESIWKGWYNNILSDLR